MKMEKTDTTMMRRSSRWKEEMKT